MERLNQRLETTQKALDTLRKALTMEKSEIARDAAIQRFEYTFEAVWKAAQRFLRKQEGIEEGSPKGVIRSSFRVGLLDEKQARLAMEMADDRNLTVHTYNEELAEKIYSRLPGYSELVASWLQTMRQRASH